jgi:hypothetical protein
VNGNGKIFKSFDIFYHSIFFLQFHSFILTLFWIGLDDLFWLLRYGDVMKISSGQLMLDLKNRIQLYLFKIIEGLTTKFETETNV